MTPAVSACPGCGTTNGTTITSRDYNRRVSDEAFVYQRCDCCGLVFLLDVPPDLGRYYPTSYYTLPASVDELALGARHEQYKIDLVTSFKPVGRLLEVGAGNCGFSFLAQRAGFSVQVIEMDHRVCSYLDAVLGVPSVQSDDVAHALDTVGPSDVVTLWHVLEHLPDPFAALTAASKALHPGGILIVATPDPRSMQFRVWRGRWTHLDAPRHLVLLPLASLLTYARGLGLSCVWSSGLEAGGAAWNHYGWEESVGNLVAEGRRTGARRLGQLVGRAVDSVEGHRVPAATYTAVLHKR